MWAGSRHKRQPPVAEDGDAAGRGSKTLSTPTGGVPSVATKVQQVLTPHLTAMCKVLQSNWPQLEPELLLLYWLCQRHRLETPRVKLARGAQAADQRVSHIPKKVQGNDGGRRTASVTASAQSPDDCHLTMSSITPSGYYHEDRLEINPVPPPRTGARKKLHVYEVDADLMEEDTITSAGATTRAPTTLTSTSVAGTARPPTTARSILNTPSDIPNTTSNIPNPPQPPMDHTVESTTQLSVVDKKPPILKHLARINHLLALDARGSGQANAAFKQNAAELFTNVAMLRQGIRGRFVANVPLLSHDVLTREEQFQLVGMLKPATFEQGDHIIDEGDLGDELFIIEHGKCNVLKNHYGEIQKVAEVRKGDFFGELGVLWNMPRNATVVALTAVTVLSLQRDCLFSTLDISKIEHMRVLGRMQIFGNVPLLRHLDGGHKSVIAKGLRPETWPAGSVIISENQQGLAGMQRLHVIDSGICKESRLSLTTTDGNLAATSMSRVITRRSVFNAADTVLHSGSYFGMLEVLYSCPYQSTITAITDVQTFSMGYDDLIELLADKDDAANEIPPAIAVMKRSVRTHLLRQADAFLRDESEEELSLIIDSATEVHFTHWQMVLMQGTVLDGMLMLETGTCLECDGDRESLIDSMESGIDCWERSRPGTTFGTCCVLMPDQTVAPFTLVAVSACTMLHISKECLDTLPCLRSLYSDDSSSSTPSQRGSVSQHDTRPPSSSSRFLPPI
eukprot:NODE_1247_length_2548_cov_10.323007.p1 GENE.NODE_1247_length_2548_cov_10.323007~~NODE_1247_length_2548_cov_10.323007.p1  ORF type:complete len:736 (+),score=202.37 NODE_1247_length_2548_cov_10.323007:93-2300(+)